MTDTGMRYGHGLPGKESTLFTDSPLMTIRVSQDSGKTWGPERAVFATDGLPPLITAEWPPCQCRRCDGRSNGSRR